MNVLKSCVFIADVERQFEWYAINAGWDVADRYLDAVEASILLIGQHPQIGARGGFVHARLRDWRFLIVFRPFNRHLLFYELIEGGVVMRRAMHGHRNLQRGATVFRPEQA